MNSLEKRLVDPKNAGYDDSVQQDLKDIWEDSFPEWIVVDNKRMAIPKEAPADIALFKAYENDIPDFSKVPYELFVRYILHAVFTQDNNLDFIKLSELTGGIIICLKDNITSKIEIVRGIIDYIASDISLNELPQNIGTTLSENYFKNNTSAILLFLHILKEEIYPLFYKDELDEGYEDEF